MNDNAIEVITTCKQLKMKRQKPHKEISVHSLSTIKTHGGNYENEFNIAVL